MKKTRRILAAVLAVVLGLSLLYGCSRSDSGQTADMPKITEAPAENAGPPVTITWLPQCDAQVDRTKSDGVNEVEKMLNVKFDFIYLDRNQMAQLLNVRIASGDIPDVLFINGNGTLYKSFANQGVLAEVPMDYLKKKAPNYYSATVKLCGEETFAMNSIKGKLYGFPGVFVPSSYPFIPILRDDWMRNVGVSKVPETLEEAESLFYKFVNDDPDKNGKKDTYALSITGIKAVFGAYGGQPLDFMFTEKDKKVVPTATMPEMKAALTKLAKWYKDGLIDPEFVTGENKGQSWSNTVTFWNGKIGYSVPGMYYNSTPPLDPKNPNDKGSNNYIQFHKIQGDSASYIITRPFKGPDGKAGVIKWGLEGAGIGAAIGKQVEKDQKKYDKIVEIFDRANGDFQFNLLVNKGVEGKHYKYVPGADTEYPSILDTAADPLAAAKAGLSANGLYLLRNNEDFVHKADDPKPLIKYIEPLRDWPSYQNVIRQPLDSDPQFNAPIMAKIQETYYKIILGSADIAEFDKLAGELDKMGLPQLLKEANEWYTTYKVKK